MTLRASMFALSLAVMTVLLGVAFIRVSKMERRELQFEGAWGSLAERMADPSATRISARLAQVRLRRGERALFEVCARSDFSPEQWSDALEFVVWDPVRGVAELKVPLDAAHLAQVRRSRGEACLKLGGGRVENAGEYAFDAIFQHGRPSRSLAETPLRARVLASTPLGRGDSLLVFSLALVGVIAVFAGFSRDLGADLPTRGSAVWAALGLLSIGVLGVLALAVPLEGAAGGLARGLVLAVLELGVGFAFAMRLGPPRRQLGLYAPARAPAATLALAVICAALLNPAARYALRSVPTTGESPIESFISWPSGALAFAALGMVVPLAEELFFRGFLYGALEQWGRRSAFLITAFAFALVHARQAWGNWGALLAVAVTGVVLTALRALTGSTLVPAVAHLLYNFSLWLQTFR